MTLTLVAISLDDQPLSQPITTGFDARGGTIGRADHNTMALPDPQRYVSRVQAEIVAQGSSYLIRNVGAPNPITVGGRVLCAGEVAPLADRDQVRIGGYLLQVQLSIDDDTAPLLTSRQGIEPGVGAPSVATPVPARNAAPTFTSMAPHAAPSMASTNPFADLLGAGATADSDPFADLMAVPAGVHPHSAALTPAQPTAPVARLPDDFDPFAAPPAAASNGPATPQDPFADLMPASGAASIDQAFGLAPPAGDDPLARFLGEPPPPSGVPASTAAGNLSTDPLALFGGNSSPARPTGPTQPDNLSALNAAYQPPPLRAPPPKPTATMTAATAPPPATPAPVANRTAAAQSLQGDSAALWAAFCDGAGINLALPPDQVQAQVTARQMGRIMRSAVEGTLQLMAVRASTKQELRAAVTVIQQRENNPLKFSPDGKVGLEQLLGPPMRGFLDGPAAMDDAMHDLVGHAIGTVAGMRAAIEGMLDRFAPTALEAKLVSSSVLDSVLPMNRRAKLWDLYLQHHRAIREEAQEDFDALFGKAFLAAYEQQIERLKRSSVRR